MIATIQNIGESDAPESILQAYSAQNVPPVFTGTVE